MRAPGGCVCYKGHKTRACARSEGDAMQPQSSMVRTLPLTDLHIDATYHTTLNGEAVASLCHAFTPDAFGLILVHRRADGTSWVVDGAARVLALRHLGRDQVRAELVEGWTLEQERAAYTRRNTTPVRHLP